MGDVAVEGTIRSSSATVGEAMGAELAQDNSQRRQQLLFGPSSGAHHVRAWKASFYY